MIHFSCFEQITESAKKLFIDQREQKNYVFGIIRYLLHKVRLYFAQTIAESNLN